MPETLLCVVEGKGEVAAAARLCSRILHLHLEIPASAWVVDRDPIRQPRGQLVDERAPAGRRPPREEGLAKAIRLVRARPASAALVLVDADADCPGAWGPPARELITVQIPGVAVMAVREYEAWLLAGHAAFAGPNPDELRNAKAHAQTLWRGYRPTTHQLRLTESLDLELASERSGSFRYLVESLRRLTS